MDGIRVSFDEQHLVVQWPDGSQGRFPTIWLRDNSPENRDSATGQRLTEILDIPPMPKLARVRTQERSILLDWAGESGVSCFSLDWLHRHINGSGPEHVLKNKIWPFDLDRFCWLSYPQILHNLSARVEWLRAIAQDGIAFLRGVPCQSGEVIKFAGLIGSVTEAEYVRPTDDTFAVSRQNCSVQVRRGLSVYTDEPYRDPVPSFQALHSLSSNAEDGESFLIDGYAVAEHLRQHDASAFAVLADTPVPFSFRDIDTSLREIRPIIELNKPGSFKAIYYDTRFIGPLPLMPGFDGRIEQFYGAYRKFVELLCESQFGIRLTLREGELVLFDNHRVLRSGTGFLARAQHLQGCYVRRDSLFSHLAVLERRLGL